MSSRGGKTIHISGQVGVDEDGKVVRQGDLKAQTDQAFGNIRIALAAVGASFDDVVKTSIFIVGLKAEHVPIIREVLGRYVSVEHPPANTLVGVSAVIGPDWLIEIEATAVVKAE